MISKSPKKKSINDRVFSLSQKINNLTFNHPNQSSQKLQHLQNQCQQIQSRFQNYKHQFQQKTLDLKHYIEKQLNHDYGLVDKIWKQKITTTENNIKQLIIYETQQRKNSQTRVLSFIDQQCNIIKNILHKQQRDREQQGNILQQSLSLDLRQINEKFQGTKLIWNTQLQNLQKVFMQKCQHFNQQLLKNCELYSNNQAQFYTMLKDLTKKTRQQLTQQKNKREETEQQILLLIQKMCQKVLQNIKSI